MYAAYLSKFQQTDKWYLVNCLRVTYLNRVEEMAQSGWVMFNSLVYSDSECCAGSVKRPLTCFQGSLYLIKRSQSRPGTPRNTTLSVVIFYDYNVWLPIMVTSGLQVAKICGFCFCFLLGYFCYASSLALGIAMSGCAVQSGHHFGSD